MAKTGERTWRELPRMNKHGNAALAKSLFRMFRGESVSIRRPRLFLVGNQVRALAGGFFVDAFFDFSILGKSVFPDVILFQRG